MARLSGYQVLESGDVPLSAAREEESPEGAAGQQPTVVRNLIFVYLFFCLFTLIDIPSVSCLPVNLLPQHSHPSYRRLHLLRLSAREGDSITVAIWRTGSCSFLTAPTRGSESVFRPRGMSQCPVEQTNEQTDQSEMYSKGKKCRVSLGVITCILIMGKLLIDFSGYWNF